MEIIEVDYPRDGLTSAFPKLAPSSAPAPSSWRFVQITSSEGQECRTFLGNGWTDLDIYLEAPGAIVACCNGFVYLVKDNCTVAVCPTKLHGFTSVKTSEWAVGFCNYHELLVLCTDGRLFLSPDLAFDDLDILGFGPDAVNLVASFQRFPALENRAIPFDRLAEWVPEFNHLDCDHSLK